MVYRHFHIPRDSIADLCIRPCAYFFDPLSIFTVLNMAKRAPLLPHYPLSQLTSTARNLFGLDQLIRYLLPPSCL